MSVPLALACRRLRQEDHHEFKAKLGYKIRPYLKNQKEGERRGRKREKGRERKRGGGVEGKRGEEISLTSPLLNLSSLLLFLFGVIKDHLIILKPFNQ